MNPFVSIPRDSLAELLRASGSPLTPEQYLATLPEFGIYRKYPSRARAAAWSKPVLALVTVLSVIFTVINRDLEDAIILVGLATVTYFEYRVHQYFLQCDPRAPDLGFRNQAGFAAGILIYGLYHALVPSQLEIPAEYRDVMDPAMAGTIQGMERVFYLFIGMIGGVSQFWLAWYYRNAKVGTTANSAEDAVPMPPPFQAP